MQSELSDFAGQPLESQLGALADHLAARSDPRRLLALCRALPDPTPVAWLAARLIGGGWLRQNGAADFLAAFLGDLPDTALHRTLQAVAEVAPPELAAVLEGALRRLPLERISAMSLLDRVFKSRFPLEREQYLSDLLERCRTGAPEDVPLEVLAQLSTEQMASLGQPFEPRLQAMARKIIEALGRAPKALSQSNAEEILSRRVYTEPGHFLVELLQNADDAEARRWEIRLEPERIVVWNDGLPFDARDLVGVTSIGQTTKRKQQIGFFGVGFKSLYEVTERPQVFSGVFQFEIVDVSIPRHLAKRPEDLPAGGTLLVLPLRAESRDRQASLFDRATALDPCLLLTLRHLRSLRVEMGGRVHQLQASSRRPPLFWIEHQPTGWRQGFCVQEQEREYGGAREPGRPDRTRVMVGIRVDGQGEPVPLPPRAPTLYSYLPTGEDTGLRFFIQGHFDVPVDRERVAPESEWNRWILGQVPQLLRRVAERPESAARARALLEVLPLPREITTPLLESLPAAMAAELNEVAFLPVAGGGLETPETVHLADAAMVSVALGSGVDTVRFLEPDLPERSVELARYLGCPPFGLEELISAWELRPPGPDTPWRNAHRLLTAELQKRERLEAKDELRERLRAIPLFPDSEDRARAAREVSRAEGPLRQFYSGRRALLSESVDEPWLLDWLDVPTLDLETLADDLAEGGPIADPGERGRLHRLLAKMTRHLSTGVRQRLAALPIWPDRRGAGWILTDVHLPDHPRIPELFPELAFLDPEIAQMPHVLTFSVPRVGVNELVEALAARPPAPHRLDDVLGTVAELAESVTAASVEQLFRLPLFEDAAGLRYPLGQLSLCPDQRLRELYADSGARLFLRDSSPSSEVIRRLHLQSRMITAGPGHLIQDLAALRLQLNGESPEGRPLVRSRRHLERILGYLVATREELSVLEVGRLLGQPLFCDQEGRLGPLGVLTGKPSGDRVYACQADFAPLMRGQLRVLDPDLQSQIAPLLETVHWPSLGIDALVSLLEPLSPCPPGGAREPLHEHLTTIHQLLVRHRGQLLERYAPLPDKDGRLASPTLSRIAIWPTAAGGIECAGSLLDVDEPLLDLLGEERQQLELRQLQPWSLATFQALAPLLTLAPAGAFLRELVERQARDGLPLSEQPAFLATPARVARVGELLPRDAGPLKVDASGRLRRSVLFRADPGTHRLVDGLPLEQELLHPDFPGEAPELARSKVLEAIEGRLLDEAARREAFYRWIFQDELHLFTDPECLRCLESRPLFLSADGLLRPISALIVDPEVPNLGASWSPHPEIPRAVLDLLSRHLNAGRPSARLIEFLLERERPGVRTAGAVAALLARLSPEDQQSLLERLRHQAWIPDRQSRLRRPGELLLPDGDAEMLAGSYPELYPHPEVFSALGRRLAQALGLRGKDDLRLLEIARHIDRSREAGEEVPAAVYRHLESWLKGGQRSAGEFAQVFGARRWIVTDDGSYFRHAEVLAVQAVRYFGDRRGYWKGADRRYPSLCRLFGIPNEVCPATVESFLAELASDESEVLLEREPALPRMLIACLALLGRVGYPIARDLPVIPCRLCGSDSLTLRPASAAGLVLSDTPSLERLFRPTGRLYLVERGTEERAELERFYELMEIQRLRAAYTVSVHPTGGRDATGHSAQSIQRLRNVFRALLEVLPRIRLQRAGFASDGWVYLQRLVPLAGSGTIRVVDGLKVLYQLPGVGSVEALAPAAYDPGRASLVVDRSVAEHPGAHSLGLALALISCIYEGPEEEQLVDILELLLPLGTADAMQLYLDRRHFPVAPESRRDPENLLAERLGELLDYRLDRKLVSRFPELAGSDLESWRSPDVAARAARSRRPVEFLLREAGVEAPSAELLRTLEELLHGRDLDIQEPEPEPERFAAPSPAEPLPRASRSLAARSLSAAPGPPALDLEESGLPGPSWLSGGNPLAPQPSIGPQLWATPEHRKQLAETPACAGLAFHPESLTSPYLYGLCTVGGSFDPQTQSFRPELRLPGIAPEVPTGRLVEFWGRLQPGNSRLPMPLFSRLQGSPRVAATRSARAETGRSGKILLRGPDSLGGWLIRIDGSEPVQIRYTVELLAAPPPAGPRTPATDGSLLRPLMQDSELPQPVREWLAQRRATAESAWKKALATVEFVRARYLYDEHFLTRPETLTAMARLEPGKSCHHLQLMHASPGAGHFGRGICYELNLMVLELLRRLSIPAFPATCWVFDQGWVDRPDHLVAVAVLPSPDGPTLLPLDAAVDSRGPLRPLGPNRPPGSDGADRPLLEQLERMERVSDMLGLPPIRSGSAEERLVAMRGRAQSALGDAMLLELLLQSLRGELRGLAELPPGVRELVRRDLVEVQNRPVHDVVPRLTQ